MSIVMLGLNLGASLVPYLTAIIWNGTGQAYWLPFITFLTMLVPIGLVRLTKVFQKEEIGLTFAVGPSSSSSSSSPSDSSPLLARANGRADSEEAKATR